MDDTTRLVMSRIMTDERCLACKRAGGNETARARRTSWARLLPDLRAPNPQSQDNIRCRATSSTKPSSTGSGNGPGARSKRRRRSSSSYMYPRPNMTQRSRNWGRHGASIQERRRRDRRLRAQPTGYHYEQRIRELTQGVTQREWQVAGNPNGQPAEAPTLCSPTESKQSLTKRTSWSQPSRS